VIELKNKRILRAHNRVAQEEEKRRTTCIEEILKCDHSDIAEANARYDAWGGADPEFRICLKCGLGEEGWGIGYSLLESEEVKNISRENAWKIYTAYINDDSKQAAYLSLETWLHTESCLKDPK